MVALLAGGCVLEQAELSPSIDASPSATAEATPPPTASPAPSTEPSAEATPGVEQVPQFAAGSQVATNAPGLRLRSQPGTDQRVITTLAVDTNLFVGLGPVFIDGAGWYLVRNGNPDDETFGQGWVAAGFQPDPFLIPTSFPQDSPFANPYIVGFAHTASGEYGPVLLPDGDISVRWIAASLSPDGCSVAVDLRAGSGEPVPAIRTTVGGYPAPGELFSQFFASHPELRGDLFVEVTSQCSWALTFVRNVALPDDASPSPG